MIGGEFLLHVRSDGEVYSAYATAKGALALPRLPAIAADSAVETAQGTYRFVVSVGEPRLVYFLTGGEAVALAYEVAITGTDPEGGPVEDLVYVDAITGLVKGTLSKVHPALNRQIYESGNINFSDLGTLRRQEGQAPVGDPEIDVNYDLVGRVYEAYLALFGRDSYDGIGSPQISSVKLQNCTDCAFWKKPAMWFGSKGSWALPCGQDLDCVAHEFTHGVIEASSELFYGSIYECRESAALNEGWADIMAGVVDWYHGDNSYWSWILEDAFGGGSALRYLDDPARDGISDDFYPGVCRTYYAHYASGIARLAYYLLVNGGTHPRGKSSVNVAAVGKSNAAEIFYRRNNSYLLSSSDYQAARYATAAAANDLYGLGNRHAVHKAWDAVNVPATVPAAPYSLSAYFVPGGAAGYAQLMWYDAAGNYVDYWEIERKGPHPDDSWQVVFGTSQLSCSVGFSPMDPGGEYQFRVRANNPLGYSDYSHIASCYK